MKNFVGSELSPKANQRPVRRGLSVITGNCNAFVGSCRLGVFAAVVLAWTSAAAAQFCFDRDTFAFQNATVLKYKGGHPYWQVKASREDPASRYTRRCFVMTRTAMQFRKFARFDPGGAPLNDLELAARIRAVARRMPWRESLPENQRIVFSGYANLRALSKARAEVFKQNIGSGFLTYFRPSNARMLFEHSRNYQQTTHANLDAALSRGDLFVGFLSTYPKLSINHAVLVYAQKKARARDGLEHYLVYDPNHAEAPRELTWSPGDRAFAYQKDIDFIGGFVRVYQTYGKLLQ